MTMSNEDLTHWMAAEKSGELADAVRKLAAAVEVFRRGMVVCQLFGGQRDETFKEGIEAIHDDGFLRDLENFGNALAHAARQQRTKAQAKSMGDAYSKGA